MFIFVFIAFIALYFGIHIWLFIALLQTISPLPNIAKIAIIILFWGFSLSFFAMQLLRNTNLNHTFGHLFYWGSCSWIAFVLYLSISFALVSLLKIIHINIPNGFLWCLLFSFCLLIVGFINFSHPKIKYQDIKINKSIAELSNLKIVAISDVHLGYGITRNRLKKYVDMINKEKPDLILIGGDLIDMTTQPLFAEKMYEELNRLSAKYGIFMVLGNHEYISNVEKSLSFIEKTNITLLRDTVALLPNGIQIIGRDDKSNQERMALQDLMQQTNALKPIILLDHQPANETIEQMNNLKIDFGFFGHTHNGQFFPINLLTSLIFKHSYGFSQMENSQLYVSSGLGLWGPPFRIGTNSEIVVLNVIF